MEKKVALILMGLLFLGASSLFASETAKKECVFKKIASVEARGIVNIVTSPLEVVATGRREIKMHPRLWPVTYVPRFIGNLVVRIVSSANDVFVLPWYVAWGDDTPVTRGFDLPDYAWQRD